MTASISTPDLDSKAPFDDDEPRIASGAAQDP